MDHAVIVAIRTGGIAVPNGLTPRLGNRVIVGWVQPTGPGVAAFARMRVGAAPGFTRVLANAATRFPVGCTHPTNDSPVPARSKRNLTV